MENNLVGPVADALAALKGRDVKILEMTFVEGLNATEIAERLGMTPAAVWQQRHRLIGRLAGNEQLKALHSSQDDELEPLFEDARDFPYREDRLT